LAADHLLKGESRFRGCDLFSTVMDLKTCPPLWLLERR
jgi:hypothetical protein